MAALCCGVVLTSLKPTSWYLIEMACIGLKHDRGQPALMHVARTGIYVRGPHRGVTGLKSIRFYRPIRLSMPSMLTARVVGVVGGLPFSPFYYCLLAACTAIAWAYCLELTIVIFYTFRRRDGLYFWSLLISSWGCAFHALGFVLKFLTDTPSAAFLVFIEIGTHFYLLLTTSLRLG